MAQLRRKRNRARVKERLGDKARVEEEKPESRRIFGLDLEEIVAATAREYGKGVEESKRRRRGGQNEARMVAIYLGRQLGGHKHEEIGKTVGLGKTSSVSSAYLLMKKRMFKEKELVRRVRRIEQSLQTAKSRLDPFRFPTLLKLGRIGTIDWRKSSVSSDSELAEALEYRWHTIACYSGRRRGDHANTRSRL